MSFNKTHSDFVEVNGKSLTNEMNDVNKQLADTAGYLEQIAVNIKTFGTFGTTNDNENFSNACDYVSKINGILLVESTEINLTNAIIPEIPSMLFVDSVINIEGDCEFNRSLNGFRLENVKVNSKAATTIPLFRISGIDGAVISKFSFNFNATDAIRCSSIFNLTKTTNVLFDDASIKGVNTGISIADRYIDNAVSKNIKIRNVDFYNTKTGIYLSAYRTPYSEDNFIRNVEIDNVRLINTLEESNQFTGVIAGADLLMFERVKDVRVNNIECHYPIERIIYFNVVENALVNNINGYNCQGVKIAGFPSMLSKNITIDNASIYNQFKGGFFLRSYFSERCRVLNSRMDNSKMTLKPSNALSFTSYVKDFTIDNFYCEGIDSHTVVTRIDEFGDSSENMGFAFVDFEPQLNITIRNSEFINVSLGNVNSNLFNFIWTIQANNPSYQNNPNILQGKEVIKDLTLANVKFEPVENYQGAIGFFQNTKGLKLNCRITNYNNLITHRFATYVDDLTKLSSKTIQVDMISSGAPPAFTADHISILNSAADSSYAQVKYKNGATYKIFKNALGSITGFLNIESELFRSEGSDVKMVNWRRYLGERYTLEYIDEKIHAKAMIDEAGNISVTKSDVGFITSNTDGNICLFRSGEDLWLTNRTGEGRICSVRFTKMKQ